MHAIDIKDGEVKVLDVIDVDPYIYVPSHYLDSTYKINYSGGITGNHRGNELYLCTTLDYRLNPDIPLVNYWFKVYQSATLERIRFDENTLRFIPERKVLDQHKFEWNPFQTDYLKHRFEMMPNSVSLNDSFLYYSLEKEETKYQQGIPMEAEGKPVFNSTFMQLNLYTEEIAKVSEFRGWSKIAPNGELFVFLMPDNAGIPKENQIYKIPRAGKAYPNCGLEQVIYDGDNYLQSVTWNNHISDYLFFDWDITQGCEAEVSFKNEAIHYKQFEKFTWFITNEEGGEDTLYGFEPKVSYTTPGNYAFRVLGESSKLGGYSEYYYDTLRIDLPKFEVDFTVATEKVCRYVPLQFTNQSISERGQPSTTFKYLWDFGDGNTSEAEHPVHVYKEPGKYSVSLWVDDGHCNKTKTKTFLVEIIDAPKPGFSLSDNRGCSPLSVRITDTVSLNTEGKAYYFSDSGKWTNIHTEVFTKEYEEPGVYSIVQRLYGASGCTTQLDTQKVYVTQGTSKEDTAHIVNTSYQTNDQIEISIASTGEGIVGYDVFRNAQKVGRSETKTYIDRVNEPNEYTYRVVGVDSCGNSSSEGLYGTPILLKGQVLGSNDMSYIEYSSYGGWKSEVVGYELYEITATGAQQITELGKSENVYTDKEFKAQGQYEKCYRVDGYNSEGIRSKSNVVCLPYVPSVFIPTSFTPNNDAINEVFQPITVGVRNYRIKIYNRWGELVFDAENTGWNGYYQNKPVPTGAYYYTLQLEKNGEQTGEKRIEHISGTVFLVK